MEFPWSLWVKNYMTLISIIPNHKRFLQEWWMDYVKGFLEIDTKIDTLISDL